MRYLATLIFISSCCALHAQGKWGIRLNQNTDFFSITNIDGTSSLRTSEVTLNRISAAVSYVNDKYTHELELFVPQANGSSPTFPGPHEVHVNPGYKHKCSSYAMRYSISRKVYSFMKSFSLSLGGGLNAYFLKNENVPQDESVFLLSNSAIGVSLNVIPGLNFQATKHLSFMLDCPLKILDVYRKTEDVKNPAIPIRQQKASSFEGDFLMKAFTVRMGVGYRFGG